MQQTAQADRQTLQAPRFDCDFHEKDNLARLFTATGGAKATIDPLQPSEKRSTRTLISQKMIASFARETQDVERLDAQRRQVTSATVVAVANATYLHRLVSAAARAIPRVGRARAPEAAEITPTAGADSYGAGDDDDLSPVATMVLTFAK